MNDFINIIEKYPQAQIKLKYLLDKYSNLPYNYHSKIGYDTSIQSVIFNDLLKLMGTTIVDAGIELKMKISRIKYLEIKCSYKCTLV